MSRSSTGMGKNQGFGPGSRKSHPTKMGGYDRTPLPTKPKMKMMADALRAKPTMEEINLGVIQGKARTGAGNKRK